MTVEMIAKTLGMELKNGNGDREVLGEIYCCDLLSLAMARAPKDSVWITVMGNVNAMAVASLADVACIVIAEGMPFDDAAKKGAAKANICVLQTKHPVFEAAQSIANLIKTQMQQ